MADFKWEDYEEEEPFDWGSAPIDESYANKTGVESAIRGLAQGGSLGFADEVIGGLKALLKKTKGSKEDFKKLYERERDIERQAYKEAEASNPKTYMGGNIAGSIGTAFIPGLNVAKGASLASAAGRSALQGALTGAGATEENVTSGQGVKEAVTGGFLGAAGGALGQGLGKFFTGAPSVTSKLDETAERLAARALGAERGTVKKIGEEKVREAGRYALEKGIVSPLSSSEQMILRNAAAKNAAGETMGNVYKIIDEAQASTFNPMSVAGRINEELGGFWRSPINKAEAKQLDNMLEAITMRGTQDLPIKEAQVLKEEIGKVANWKSTVNPTDKERMARDAYGIVSQAIDDATESGAKSVGILGLPKTLKGSKKDYSNAKVVESLLENRQARELGNKLFGLTDTIAGAAGLAGAVPTGGMSIIPAAALVGAKKLGEKYGPQSLAVGADELSSLLRSVNQGLGVSAAPIQSSIRAAGQAAAPIWLNMNNKRSK